MLKMAPILLCKMKKASSSFPPSTWISVVVAGSMETRWLSWTEEGDRSMRTRRESSGVTSPHEILTYKPRPWNRLSKVLSDSLGLWRILKKCIKIAKNINEDRERISLVQCLHKKLSTIFREEVKFWFCRNYVKSTTKELWNEKSTTRCLWNLILIPNGKWAMEQGPKRNLFSIFILGSNPINAGPVLQIAIEHRTLGRLMTIATWAIR